MAVTIDQVTAQKFNSVLYQLAQQKESKFASRVRRETCAGYETAYFDTLAAFDLPTQQTERHGDTPLIEPDFARRKVTPSKWELGTMLDSYDLQRMQTNPQGAIVEGFAYSLGRKKDDIIYAALLGAATIGKAGGSSVAGLYAETGHYDIDGDGTLTALNTLPAEGTPISISLATILLMQRLFNDDDVDADMTKHWAVSPNDLQVMLAIEQLTSSDYQTVRNLIAGKVDSVVGFSFFCTTRLSKDAAASTCWRTVAWAEKGIVLATIGEPTTEIDKRPDKKNEKQIYSKMDLGAVRLEGKMVHECLTKVT